MQTLAQVVSIVIALVGIVLFVKAIRQIVAVLRLGQPAARTDRPVSRGTTLLKESLGHTRMLQWTWVGVGHWFIFIGFGLLFFTLVTAFGQLFHADYALPIIGHWFLFEWLAEIFTVLMLVAIVAFIGYRVSRPKERTRGPDGRFFGSTTWQAYFVEAVILGVGLCIAVLRGAEYALAQKPGETPVDGWHYPLSILLGKALGGMSVGGLENLIYVVAMLKIVISFTWMIVISINPTMGVAWHRFLAFFNIFFKRESSGRTALGGLQPMTSGGKVLDFEDLDDMDEDTVLGVGKVEDFSWKGILDFTTCTECGRCQSQCPAWNTEKPLSPKLLITALRDHAWAKAPYLLADSDEARSGLDEATRTEAERPLVGATEGDWAWNPTGGAVIDDDVLWSCTSCGACVQQCPVDIEHVDHIIDMRRYQVLVESNFPTQLNGLFKGLENKGNPWNMSPKARLEWTQGLDFEVKVVGGEGPDDPESLDEVEWLFWVGCAGAYEDRAKKTTRAVAELLNMAGVDFAVLGNGETCTGDPARRAGNEFVFQGLATENAETLKETKAKKVVSTCAHCFNTLKNEYAAFGVELEVVHHTQLLNRLVREKKLTPVASQGGSRSVTYHDPCFIGRHNGVYSPPRELLAVIPDAVVTEMPRNSERSFCCGAGGARMWMEETIGERINVNRTKEAVETGADQIAVGCPFCRVMLSDGLTAQQAAGEAREEVEVLDVAQMLLASVKGETPAPVLAKAAASGATATATATAVAATEADEDTHAEPEAGDATQTDDTITDTTDSGPLAKASGGSSLFDTPEATAPEPGTTATADDSVSAAHSAHAGADVSDQPAKEPSAAGGGSLFDLGGDAEPKTEAKAEPNAVAKAEPEASAEPQPKASSPAPSSGGDFPGSLFDAGPAAGTSTTSTSTKTETKPEAEPEPEAKTEPEPEAEPDASVTQTVNDEPAAKVATTSTDAAPASEIGGGSLFDIAAPEAPAAAQPTKTPTTAGASDTAQTPETTETAETAETAEMSKPSEPETVAEEPEPASTSVDHAASTAPAAEIGGGSLFDIAAPAVPSAPAPETTTEPQAKTEEPDPAAAEPADTPESPTEPVAEAKASEPTPEPEAEAPVRSLRDIKAEFAAKEAGGDAGTDTDTGTASDDTKQAEPAVASAAATEAETQETGSSQDSDADAPQGTTQAASDAAHEAEVSEPEQTPEADVLTEEASRGADEDVSEPENTASSSTEATTSSSADANAPKKEIGGGSLFDL